MHRISFSQVDSLDIYNYNFDQLSKLKITTPSKAPQEIVEVPSTIFLITATEIKERGYFTLEEALADLPGFQFRNIIGFNSYVFQRGIPSQNNLILVLIDGIQVNELNSGGFYGGGQYNLSNVERIEVIYGPASVAYGTNAVSGIINIITKNKKEKQVEVNSLAGNFHTVRTNFNYGFFNEKNDFLVRLSGMYKQSDKADLRGEAGDNNWSDLMDNFENDYSFDFQIQAKDFTLGANYLQKQSSMATYIKSTGTNYKDYGTLWNIRFLNNYLKYNKNISKSLSLNSMLYKRNTTVLDNTIQFVLDTAQVGYYRPNNLIGIETTIDYTANTLFSITGGVTLESEQLAKGFSITYSSSAETRPSAPKRPDMENNYLASIFIEPRLNLLKNLYLSGGFRFDQSSIYDQVITPRAGIIYKLHKQLIRFSYSEAFRAPKPWDYTDGLGNTTLLPEKMRSLEGALSFSLSNNYMLDIIAYKNILDDAITKEVINNNYRWVNYGEINTNGLEISFRYSTKKLKSSLNYTFNQSYDENKVFIPEISEHCGNASVTYIFNNYINLNLRANYVGERKSPQIITSTGNTIIDPYLIFNGTLTITHYKNLTIQLITKNILNTKYYHPSNRPPDRYRQPQRTMMLSIGYALNNKE